MANLRLYITFNDSFYAKQFCVIMTSEQFALSWNDFQEKVSSSFKKLRIEKDFFDVTLVSDDEDQVSAHKLLLSACSSFFKSILKKNSNPHPIIYLSGIDSRNLNLIVDYIYQGEVQIYQDQLDKFLEVAKKLKIEGLLSSNEQKSGNVKKENTIALNKSKKINLNDISYEGVEDVKLINSASTMTNKKEVMKLDTSYPDVTELEETIQGMLIVDVGGFTCSVCNKRTRQKKDMQRHIESHIGGLSFPCSNCGKSFKSRHSLAVHTARFHTTDY